MSNSQPDRLSIEPFYMLRMSAYEARELQELEASQVTHPVDEYKPGSPRLERLYEQMAENQRHQFAADFGFNL